MNNETNSFSIKTLFINNIIEFSSIIEISKKSLQKYEKVIFLTRLFNFSTSEAELFYCQDEFRTVKCRAIAYNSVRALRILNERKQQQFEKGEKNCRRRRLMI